MEKVTELTTRRLLEDGAAALGQVTAALGQANVKILAMTAGATSGGRIMNMRMLVEDPARGTEALESARISVFPNEALSLTLDRPNAFTEVTDKLAGARVRIDAAYFSAAGDSSLAVLSVSNVGAAQDALQSS